MTSFAQIFFPTVRITVPGLGNPAYIDDVKAANQLMVDGLAALLGLYNTDGFCIVSGFTYDPNAKTYGPGVFYFNQQFYYQQVVFPEGSYLKPNPSAVMPKNFSDTNARPIYMNYVSIETNDPAGATPIFQGDMNASRMGIFQNVGIIHSLQDVVNTLGTAAFAKIGTTPGTVAAGNDTRLVGDSDYFDGRYAKKTDVILKNLANDPGEYDPVQPWDPVNKRYADATSGRRAASGTLHVGDADTQGGTLYVVDMGTVVQGAAYLITFSTGSLSANHNVDIFYQTCWVNKAQSSFGLWFREAQAGVQNIQLDWIAWLL